MSGLQSGNFMQQFCWRLNEVICTGGIHLSIWNTILYVSSNIPGWSNVHHPHLLSHFVVIFKEIVVSSQRIIMVRFAGSENGVSTCVQNAGSRPDKSRGIQNFRLIAPCYLLIRRKLLHLLLDNLVRCCYLTLIQRTTL